MHAPWFSFFFLNCLSEQLKQQQLADIADGLQKERDVVERYKKLKFV